MTTWVLVLGTCLNGECEPILDVDKEMERLTYTTEYNCHVAGLLLNYLVSQELTPPHEAEYKCFKVEV